jgi:2OG-Fe(II) oxygenase superfamily
MMISATIRNNLRRKRSTGTNYCIGCQLCITLISTSIFVLRHSTVLAFTRSNVAVDNIAGYRIKTVTELSAGKKGSSSPTKSKNSRQSNVKGGFGRIAIPRNDLPVEGTIDDDYKVFPALESRVRDTLIPASTVLADITTSNQLEADIGDDGRINIDVPLSSEIYQRLDQIYGFPLFNYDNNALKTSVSKDTQNAESLPVPRSPLELLMNTDSTDNDFVGQESAKESVDSTVVSLSLQELPPFSNVRVLHIDPMVLSIDNFFTQEECEQYILQSETNSKGGNGDDGTSGRVMQSRSPTVGKDSAAKAQRTSTTFYHKYDTVPELMSKASRLLGIPTIHQWEEPQTVRYRKNEKFTWHLDALGPIEQQSSSSGQRTATLLVYLTDLNRTEGGATLFRDLGNAATAGADPDGKYLRVQPKQGMALLFFPSAGGITDCPFDIRTLHCGEVISNDAVSDKWIAQLWLRQRAYKPTAPPGNRHIDAYPAIVNYCKEYATKNKS